MWMLWLILIVPVPLIIWGFFLKVREYQDNKEKERQTKETAVA